MRRNSDPGAATIGFDASKVCSSSQTQPGPPRIQSSSRRRPAAAFLLPDRDFWEALVQESIEAEYSTGVAEENDERKDDIGLIDSWSPRNGALCTEIIKQQKDRQARRQTRGQPKDKRDRDINLDDHNQRTEHGATRNDHCVEKTRVPGVAVCEGVFQKSSDLVRPRVAVITEEKTDSEINSGKCKEPFTAGRRSVVSHLSVVQNGCRFAFLALI